MSERQINDQLVIYGRRFSSRLLLGTARYESPSVLDDAIRTADPAMLTVSLRRQVAGLGGCRTIFLESASRDPENHSSEYCWLSHSRRSHKNCMHGT